MLEPAWVELMLGDLVLSERAVPDFARLNLDVLWSRTAVSPDGSVAAS